MVKLSLAKWLLRSRDTNAVSYSRFGMPGDEQEERPPPTTIVLEPFEENASQYRLGSLCHAQKGALLCAGFGMSVVLLMFISVFFEFDWYHHERGVDFLALLALFLYLAIGMLVHYGIIHGIKVQRAHFLVPFLIAYMGTIVVELISVVTAVADLALFTNREFSDRHRAAIYILLVIIPCLVVQCVMLLIVWKCKLYLTKKEFHQIALQVAQKSLARNPSIRIVNGTQNNTEEIQVNSNDSQA
uniref:Uncharacterized protein n=1 Tax=Plectus sambesii TaxID=2011161 RepID=A0A914WNF8_9BILA